MRGASSRAQGAAAGASRSDVRSLVRAFELLEYVADRGGEASVSELATGCDLPVPTVHRLVRTLLKTGAMRQLPSRRYMLGPQIVRLGEVGNRMLGATVRPLLAGLADATEESANMAVLDQGRAVYVAHVPSHRSMRMFTQVGRRAHLHSTGVGKAILAQLPDADVVHLLEQSGLPARTPRTITDLALVRDEVDRARRDGFAVDDEEEEEGVRCVAVPVPHGPSPAAVSVSAPAGRLGPRATDAAIAALRRAASVLTDHR